MNKVKVLPLILASAVIAGAFSATVNASAYKFSEATVLSAHEVHSGVSDTIDLGVLDLGALNLKPGETKKFVLSVDEGTVQASDGALVAGAHIIGSDDLHRYIEGGEQLARELETVARQNFAGHEVAYAGKLRDAVEWMAEIRGETKSAANALSLEQVVRKVLVAFSNAMHKVNAADKLAEDFKLEALRAKKDALIDDPDNLDDRLKRAICTRAGAAALAAHRVRVGVCVGDAVTGLAGNLKYRVVVAGELGGGSHVNANLRAWRIGNDIARGPCRIDDLVLVAVVVTQNDVTLRSAAGANLDAGSTFLLNRNPRDARVREANIVVIPNRMTVEAQLESFCDWCEGWCYHRAYDFLHTAQEATKEKTTAGNVYAQWLGATSAKSVTNESDDYVVTFEPKKGEEVVALRWAENPELKHVGAASGPAVAPLEFCIAAGTPQTAAEFEGVLRIVSSANSKPVRLTVKGRVESGAVASVESIQNGTKIPHNLTTQIKALGSEKFSFGVVVDKTNGRTVDVTVDNAGSMKTGGQLIAVAVEENADATELYADSKAGHKNDVAIFKSSRFASGKVTFAVDKEVLDGDFTNLSDGTKVYVYITDEKKLNAKRNPKSAAKAAASDGAVDSANMIVGEVEYGKVVFTHDPSKVLMDEDDLFLISKNKLDIVEEKLTENSAQADTQEDEAEEEDDVELPEEEDVSSEDAVSQVPTSDEAQVKENEPIAKDLELEAAHENGIAATGIGVVTSIAGVMAAGSLIAGALALKKRSD